MSWHSALAWALTGESLELPAPVPDVPLLLAQLADVGWASERIAEHASAVLGGGGGPGGSDLYLFADHS